MPPASVGTAGSQREVKTMSYNLGLFRDAYRKKDARMEFLKADISMHERLNPSDAYRS